MMNRSPPGIEKRVTPGPSCARGLRRALTVATLLCAVFAATGCQWGRSRGYWQDAQPPAAADARALHARWQRTALCDCGTRQLVSATEAEPYSAEAAGLYYGAALASARCLDAADVDDAVRRVAWETYQASSKGLLAALARQTPSSVGGPLVVTVDGQAAPLTVSMHGFAWDAEDFQRLTVVESYCAESLSRVHRRCGVGVPVVIERRQRTGRADERFLPARSVFAATAVLRPASRDEACATGTAATLDLYNPHAIATIGFGGRRMPLAGDLSAALAYHGIRESPAVNPITWFLDPGASTGDEGLYFLEPYQPGKIPIVFVHGLVSSPSTWTDMVNDLRATPGFDEHYQVWAFRYATGSSFLRAAAHLRRSLYEAAATVDPHGEDAALDSMVLVGHSMGGLVSKLQVVDSGDTLWRSVAARPLEQIAADAATRQELAEVLFFERNPHVRRVVFIAVPHGGSSWATRPVGRVASSLVRGDATRDAMHARLIADNPDVFAPAVQRRLPTSIDMLEPSNPLLVAIRGLPVSPEVRVHSVIGTGGMFSAVEPSDGVVPAASAYHASAETTTYIPARHERVHREEEAVRKVQAILAQHLAEYAAASAQAKRAVVNRDGR